jgi:hypothetical protein
MDFSCDLQARDKRLPSRFWRESTTMDITLPLLGLAGAMTVLLGAKLLSAARDA